MLNLVRLYSPSFVVSSRLLFKPPPRNNPLFLKNNPIGFTLRKEYNSSAAPTHCAHNGVVSHHKINKEEDDKYSKVGLKQGDESMIPKHVAICLDGTRRWLNQRGLELCYEPFFRAQMKFAEYCLKWGVPSATSYINGLGNLNLRSKEANDLLHGQFERLFLEEGFENFTRKGIKVSIVGERHLLPDSCQATIKKVEEATRNNTNLDLVLPTCYSSQRDIVIAAKKICNKVMQGEVEIEDIDEDLFEQHISVCSSRPQFDLFIRTGGQLRTGMLLGWQAPHTELYISDVLSPDFGEDVFLDALRSFQQRIRLFGG